MADSSCQHISFVHSSMLYGIWSINFNRIIVISESNGDQFFSLSALQTANISFQLIVDYRHRV